MLRLRSLNQDPKSTTGSWKEKLDLSVGSAVAATDILALDQNTDKTKCTNVLSTGSN